ncbi:MAG: AbrB/MazE/SpoVT family DNA-binding domain-containing protein [Candidatus Korarchaeota archaeon]|nr:AbrB/MazE/SpoVT family DNA-binding domain-containing protein [Candidatus Korarchaeota archaeon]
MGDSKQLTVKVDDRGRITLPKQLREELQLHPGEELVIREEKGVIHIFRQFQPPKKIHSKRKWGKEAFLDAGEATFGEKENFA